MASHYPCQGKWSVRGNDRIADATPGMYDGPITADDMLSLITRDVKV